jgi:hypothetical protein
VVELPPPVDLMDYRLNSWIYRVNAFRFATVRKLSGWLFFHPVIRLTA